MPAPRLLQFVAALGYLARDTRGNVAMFFALALVPILLATGTAVDLGRAYIVKTRMESALDSAALAVGSAADGADLTVIAQQFFDANYPPSEMGTPSPVVVTVADSGNTITVTTTAVVQTTFMQIAHIDSLDVNATSQAKRSVSGLMVAMVLDNTGSMWSGGNIGALRTAAGDLLTILWGGQPTDSPNPYLKVSLVPFVAGVNPGPSAMGVSSSLGISDFIDTSTGETLSSLPDTGWIKTDDLVHLAKDMWAAGQKYQADTGLSDYPTLLTESNMGWKGCVMERSGRLNDDDTGVGDSPSSSQQWHISRWDNNPSYDSSQPTTYTAAVPPTCTPVCRKYRKGSCTQWGEECSGGSTASLNNLYWIGTSDDNYDPADPGSTDHGPYNSNGLHGPNLACPTEVTPLTNDYATINDAISNMNAWNRGGTWGDIGLSWGRRVLSPQPPFEETAATDPQTGTALWDSNRWIKAVIMMTDGVSNPYKLTGNAGVNSPLASAYSDYTAYDRLGRPLANEAVSTTNINNATNAINTNITAVCDQLKSDGIIIYTITFNLSNATLQGVYEDCASNPGNYYNSPDQATLISAFQSIGNELTKLRLSR